MVASFFTRERYTGGASKEGEFMVAFGSRLEKLRRAQGLSRKTMAKRLSLSVSTYRDLEYGSANQNLVVLLPKLSDILTVDIYELLTGKAKRGAAQSAAKIKRVRSLCQEMFELLDEEE